METAQLMAHVAHAGGGRAVKEKKKKKRRAIVALVSSYRILAKSQTQTFSFSLPAGAGVISLFHGCEAEPPLWLPAQRCSTSTSTCSAPNPAFPEGGAHTQRHLHTHLQQAGADPAAVSLAGHK